MNPAETSYTIRAPYPVMLQRGRAATTKIEVYRDGALSAPTASGSTYTLLSPSGSTVVSGAVTVSSSVATYSLSAGDLPSTLQLGEGYQEVWVLVLADGTTRTFDREAAVILRPLYPVVTDLDLTAMYPDLATWRGSDVTSMQGFIDEAWRQILSRLIAQGVLPYLVKSAHAFRTAHQHLALAIWAGYAAKGRAGANFLELATMHRAAYEEAWKAINFAVDTDHDGRVDDPHKRIAAQPVTFLSGGRPRWGW